MKTENWQSKALIFYFLAHMQRGYVSSSKQFLYAQKPTKNLNLAKRKYLHDPHKLKNKEHQPCLYNILSNYITEIPKKNTQKNLQDIIIPRSEINQWSDTTIGGLKRKVPRSKEIDCTIRRASPQTRLDITRIEINSVIEENAVVEREGEDANGDELGERERA